VRSGKFQNERTYEIKAACINPQFLIKVQALKREDENSPIQK
jgi:hypothetical protein